MKKNQEESKEQVKEDLDQEMRESNEKIMSEQQIDIQEQSVQLQTDLEAMANISNSAPNSQNSSSYMEGEVQNTGTEAAVVVNQQINTCTDSEQKYSCTWLSPIYSDNHCFKTNSEFAYQWTCINSGQTPWPADCVFRCLSQPEGLSLDSDTVIDDQIYPNDFRIIRKNFMASSQGAYNLKFCIQSPKQNVKIGDQTELNLKIIDDFPDWLTQPSTRLFDQVEKQTDLLKGFEWYAQYHRKKGTIPQGSAFVKGVKIKIDNKDQNMQETQRQEQNSFDIIANEINPEEERKHSEVQEQEIKEDQPWMNLDRKRRNINAGKNETKLEMPWRKSNQTKVETQSETKVDTETNKPVNWTLPLQNFQPKESLQTANEIGSFNLPIQNPDPRQNQVQSSLFQNWNWSNLKNPISDKTQNQVPAPQNAPLQEPQQKPELTPNIDLDQYTAQVKELLDTKKILPSHFMHLNQMSQEGFYDLDENLLILTKNDNDVQKAISEMKKLCGKKRTFNNK